MDISLLCFLEQALSNRLMDVPIIFGDVHEEIDFQAIDIVLNYTKDQYISFLRQKFSVFNSSLPDEVIAQYPFDAFVSFQEDYDSISSDLHFICGNLWQARNAVKSFKSPVYTYIVTQFPSSPCPFNPVYASRYAFHLWDLFALNLDNGIPDIGCVYPFTSDDILLGDLLTSYFYEFGTTGMIRDWNQSMNRDGTNDYYVNALNKKVNIYKNPKITKCAMWQKYFGSTYWVIN